MACLISHYEDKRTIVRAQPFGTSALAMAVNSSSNNNNILNDFWLIRPFHGLIFISYYHYWNPILLFIKVFVDLLYLLKIFGFFRLVWFVCSVYALLMTLQCLIKIGNYHIGKKIGWSQHFGSNFITYFKHILLSLKRTIKFHVKNSLDFR